jgi:hypothetical protein
MKAQTDFFFIFGCLHFFAVKISVIEIVVEPEKNEETEIEIFMALGKIANFFLSFSPKKNSFLRI